MKLKKKWIVGIPLIVAIIVFVGLYYYYDRENDNSFTAAEKRWIEDNSSTIIDFDIINDYPVFGEVEVNGVFKKFIGDFSEETGIEFNVIPYYRESDTKSTGYRFRVLDNDAVLTDKDLLLQDDIYILFGKDEERINSLSELGTKTIGVLPISKKLSAKKSMKETPPVRKKIMKPPTKSATSFSKKTSPSSILPPELSGSSRHNPDFML